MKKLLFLISSLGSGGAERQMVTIASVLKERKYEIKFLCYRHDDFYKEILDANNIPVVEITCNNPLEKAIKLHSAVRNYNPDVVISMLKMPNFYALVTSLFNRKRKVITGLRGVPTFPLGKFEVVANLQFRANYIVSNSKNAMNVWLDSYPRHKNKFRIIYNAVKVGKVNTNYQALKDGRLHIVVAASCYAVKNPLGVLEALNLMPDEQRSKIVIEWYGLKNNDLVISEVTKVIDYIHKHNLQDSFLLREPTSDIANVMHQADVIGLFSINEGLPNVICEGMMLGKPIIMTPVSDYQVLVDSSNGVLCESSSSKSIMKALIEISNIKPDRLIEMGTISKQRAETLFSPENVINNWVSLIEG